MKAAERQGAAVADRVLRRFRETIFVFGTGPDTDESMAAALVGVEDLDVRRWANDVSSAAVAAAYQSDWEETRRPNEHVRALAGDRVGIGTMKHSEGHDRYAFPTLIFAGPGGEATVPGWMPYEAYAEAMETALRGSTSDPRGDPTPTDALQRWPLLTAKELETLCGADAVVPPGTVTHDWGDGLVYLTAAEATARGLSGSAR